MLKKILNQNYVIWRSIHFYHFCSFIDLKFFIILKSAALNRNQLIVIYLEDFFKNVSNSLNLKSWKLYFLIGMNIKLLILIFVFINLTNCNETTTAQPILQIAQKLLSNIGSFPVAIQEGMNGKTNGIRLIFS